MYTLGISCYYHDSSAAILKDGKVIAAVEEERFSRKKFDDDFPVVMTEKDAVKCFKYSNERYWYLRISAKLSERFTLDLNELLERNKYG